MQQLSWIWENIKGYRGRYVMSFVLATIFPLTALINPNLSQTLVDRALLAGETAILIPLVVLMSLVTLGRSGFGYGMMALSEVSSQGLVYNLRTGLYRRMQELDRTFYDKYRTGDLMTTLTSDLDMVRHNVSFVFRQILSSSVLFIGAVVYFFTINWKFTLVLVAVAPLILIVSRFYLKHVRSIYVDLREKLSRLNVDAQENIEGNRVVKAFAREDYESNKFDEKNKAFHDQNLVASYTWLRFYPWIEILAQSMTVTIMLFGGLFMIAGELTAGQFLAFSSLSWAVCDPFRQLGGLLNDLQRFFASCAKIMDVQNVDSEIVTPSRPDKSGEVRGDIEFRDVTFRFSGAPAPVLEHVSLHVRAGQTVAFMGETGSGKTTIANLITRFYDVRSGAVLVDGTDVRRWDLKALRAGIGMATQDVFLFSDTAEGNIAYGRPDLPEEDVRHFAAVADARFIESMPEGYGTIIGERGVGLSGGQKQRIALARALALRPSILILDDTTSAVDMETERYIQRQLDALDFPCTRLIIAQRVSSVKNADMIYVLGEKGVLESGTHESLINQKGYYYEIHRIQSGLEEAPIHG